MPEYPKTRSAANGRLKRLQCSLNLLLEHKLISKAEYRAAKKAIDRLSGRWKEYRISINPPSRRPGRPAAQDDRRHLKRCKRVGCELPPSPGQAYCSIEHAPCGHYHLGQPALARGA